MTSVACDICFEGFTETDRVPKVLGCGHTFCSVCLNKLLESQKMCPTCKTSITLSLEECATNFLVLKLTEVTKEKSIYYSSHAARTIKNFEKIFLIRKEMAVKSISERTSLRNLIANNLKRLQKLEMNQDILSPSLISDLEADVEKIDKVLYCCGKSDLKPTYSLTAYMSISFYLYELANRLHSREDIYAYEMGQNSKPKYGKIILNKGRIDVQALTVSNVSKGVALVSFSDLRKCITKYNFYTFIEIGSQKMSFIIVGSSYLTLRFIKLCTGETGPTFKGVRCTIAEPEQVNQYGNLQAYIQKFFKFMEPKLEIDEVYYDKMQITYSVKNKVQEDVETGGFDDYDLDILFDENKSTCSKGEVVVQMFPNGSFEITKCVNDSSSYKNVVAKMEKMRGAKVKYGTKSAVISDSGISLIF